MTTDKVRIPIDSISASLRQGGKGNQWVPGKTMLGTHNGECPGSSWNYTILGFFISFLYLMFYSSHS